MSQEDLGRMLTEELFAPPQLLILAGALLLFIAVGYASRRALVGFPDFPYRREMLWGARWMPAIMAAVLGLAMGVTYYGAVYTDYPLTCIIIGGAVFTLGMHHAMMLLPMRGEGWVFCLTAWGARLRDKQLDLDALVAKRVRQYRNPWFKYGLGGGVQLALLLMYAHLILAFTYPFDRDLARTDHDERIADQVAADVREGLGGDRALEVQAYGPVDLDALQEWGTMRQVERSLREILSLDGPAPAEEPFHLFIEVTPETSRDDGADMFERARAVLVEREVTGPWRISVYVRKGEVLARGEYP